MVRIVALHRKPPNPVQYERYYRDIHIPIALQIPGVRYIRFGRVIGNLDDTPPPYYIVSDTYFDDERSLRTALASPQMKAALDDVAKFVEPGHLTIIFSEAEDANLETRR